MPIATSNPQLPLISPNTGIRKEGIFERSGIKAVRLRIAAGKTVPTHNSNVDVVAVVTRGSGTFTVAGSDQPLAVGAVVDMTPGQPHSIEAAGDLELVVVHCRLETGADEPRCGAAS